MTLFPEMCETVLSESILGRARERGFVDLRTVNIRDFTEDKHNRVDDAPYGGGMGMLMQTQPIYDCYCSLYGEGEEKPHLIYLSPQGQTLTQEALLSFGQYEIEYVGRLDGKLHINADGSPTQVKISYTYRKAGQAARYNTRRHGNDFGRDADRARYF